jgi:YD repeat-containing protein
MITVTKLFAIGITLFIMGTASRASAGTTNFTYDIKGRLTGADYGNGMVVQYTYDTMGNRISLTAPPLPPGPPIVTTNVPIVLVSGVPPAVYVAFEGTVNANRASTTVTFEYGLTTAYGASVPATPSPVTAGITTTTVKNDLVTGLALNTTYHYRVRGVNSSGTTYGNDVTFTIPSGPSDAPVASPPGGTYNGPVTVTLTAAGALMIYYSTDGTPPSLIYSKPLLITTTSTLQAFAVTGTGMSGTMIETYTINNVVQPVMLDVVPPQYFAAIQDACTAAGNGATIKVQTATFTENLLLNTVGTIVTIKGGYEPTFTSQTGVTTVKGTLTVSKGGLVVDRLTIK